MPFLFSLVCLGIFFSLVPVSVFELITFHAKQRPIFLAICILYFRFGI